MNNANGSQISTNNDLSEKTETLMSKSTSNGDSIPSFTFSEKFKIMLHFYLAGAFILATSLILGQVCSLEVTTSISLIMCGFMWGGLELSAIHMAGHYVREWWTKLGRMISAGLWGYAQHHKGHHKAETRAGAREDPAAVDFRKRHRATPFGAWIFIVTGHLLLAAPLMIILTWLDFGTWAIIWPTCFWVGTISFYAWYEMVHWVTHWRPSMQRKHPWIYTCLRSTEHLAHHVRPLSRFGIYPMFQVIELLPHWLVRLPFDILRLLERLVGLLPFVQRWFASFVAAADTALADASAGPAAAPTKQRETTYGK
jgi:hypothetical protein